MICIYDCNNRDYPIIQEWNYKNFKYPKISKIVEISTIT